MASNHAVVLIRPAGTDDSDALYDICPRTADAGVDTTALYSNSRLPRYS